MQNDINDIDLSKIDNITFDVAYILINRYYHKYNLSVPSNKDINTPFIVSVRLRGNNINIWGDKILKAITTGIFILIPDAWTKGVINDKYNYIYDFTNYSVAYISKERASTLKNKMIKEFGLITNNKQYLVNLSDIVLDEDFENKDNIVNNIDKKQENKCVIKDLDTIKDKSKNTDILSVNTIGDEIYDMEKLSSNFTKRQMACILLKVPDSGMKWLDILILNSKNT